MRLVHRGLYNYIDHIYDNLFIISLKTGEEMLLECIEEGSICFIFRLLNRCIDFHANEYICVRYEDIDIEV